MEMSVRPWQWDPARVISDKEVWEGLMQKALWCEPFQFLTSSWLLVSVALKVAHFSHLESSLKYKFQIPATVMDQGIFRESSNTPVSKHQVLLSLHLEKHSHTCPHAAHRARKGPSSSMMNSPPILCIPLATHPDWTVALPVLTPSHISQSSPFIHCFFHF